MDSSTKLHIDIRLNEIEKKLRLVQSLLLQQKQEFLTEKAYQIELQVTELRKAVEELEEK